MTKFMTHQNYTFSPFWKDAKRRLHVKAPNLKSEMILRSCQEDKKKLGIVW
jgi:hypothetical protein